MSRFADYCEELKSRPRRWLVTGAAGFIGSALVEQLLALGQDVRALDNFATGYKRNLDDALLRRTPNSRFEFIEGDICDAATCTRAMKAIDIVLHEAALGSVPRSISDPLASHAANVNGFLQVMLAARDVGVERVVYASSSSVYGDHPDLPKQESKIGRPLSPYAATKQIDELYAHVLQNVYGMSLIGLRYFNVFGRRQDPMGAYAAVLPRWISALLSNQQCEIYGDGLQTRDFCYIDNVVQANLLAAQAPKEASGTVYNVGAGGRTTLLELFELTRGEASAIQPLAGAAEPKFMPARAGDVRDSQADISRFARAVGYAPTHDLRAGLRETVAWFAAARG